MSVVDSKLRETTVLIKSILLGSVAAASNIVLTPPSTAARPDERKKFNSEALPGFLLYTRPVVKSAFLGLFCSEQLCLLAGTCKSFLAYLPPTLRFSISGEVYDSPRLTPTFVFGSLLICASAAIRSWCYRTLGPLFTFELALRKEHKLITHGPYRLVRHPAYTGALLFILGARMCLRDEGSLLHALGLWESFPGPVLGYLGDALAVAAAVSFVARTKQEDAVLQEEFGKEWDEWAQRTPWKVVPYVF